MKFTLRAGDAVEQLRELPDESLQVVVTSIPYYKLRDYGVDGQIGLEEHPDAWVARLVDVFDEVRRVLRADGTCWVNLGDSYAQSGRSGDTGASTLEGSTRSQDESKRSSTRAQDGATWGPGEFPVRTQGRGFGAGLSGIKQKDLLGRDGIEAAADVPRRLAQELEHIGALPDHADQRVRAKRLRVVEKKIRALLDREPGS